MGSREKVRLAALVADGQLLERDLRKRHKMHEIVALAKQVRKSSRQGVSLANFISIVIETLPLSRYVLAKFGWRKLYSFWYTKLFVADEGGEFDLLAPSYRVFPGLLQRPYKIEIEHTTVCNKKCRFCSHSHWEEKQEQMSFDTFQRIVDDIGSLKWINMAGIGSNFLNRDFIKMIEYASARHINVNFVDEFDFFDEEKARKVIELGVNSIYVSFDAATKETYEMMKKGCNFDRSLANIKALLRLKQEMGSPFPILHFRYIVTTLNYQEMPEYLELIHGLENRGIRSRVEFIGLITFPGIEEFHMPTEAVPEEIMLRTLEKALKYKINLYFSHAASRLPFMSRCTRWAEPFILVNGDVISDCAILLQSRRRDLHQNRFGNVFEEPFMTIWRSEAYREFRRLVVTKNGSVPKSCLNCCAFNVRERAEKFGVWDFGEIEDA
jgi:MoaA/NifB/PqqE/SkfB family radical SAM enzyme